MTLYFPLIPFPLDDEGEKICDYILQGFTTEEDAKELYPTAKIKAIEFPDDNIHLN